MKKKIKNIAPIATLGIVSSLAIGTVVGQIAEMSSREIISYNNALSKLAPDDFISQPLRNNKITNSGNTNFQFQDQVSSADVNDPELFNRNSVLSSQSILTVRSEHFYFNFIKPASVGANGAYNIVSTPVDPNSTILPQKFDTLGITLLNGSAIWLNNSLIIAGQVGASQFDIVALSVDNQTGILTENHRIVSTSSNNNNIFSLSNSATKTLVTEPGITGATTATFIPETVASFPVYLSPVTNYQNSESSEFVAWSADTTWGGGTGIVGSNSKQPVVISYDSQNGFSIETQRNFVTPIISDTLALPNNVANLSAMNAQKIKAITPVRHENGALELYIYSYGMTTAPALGYMNVTRVTTSQTEYIVKEFLREGIPIFEGQTNIENEMHLNSRDSTSYIPYALSARGDENDPTETSSTINLLWFMTYDTLSIPNGIPSTATNVMLDTSNGLEGNILDTIQTRNLYFFQPGGTIFTNFMDIDQLSYGVGGNLQDGIFVAVSYRGISVNRRISRSGSIRWQQPWNSNLWSADTLFSGTQIVLGHALNPIEVVDDLIPDVTGTIYNGILSTPGIYQVQRRNLTNPDAPLTPTQRVGVTVTTKNLNNNAQNIYNTDVPRHVTLAVGANIDPASIGTVGINNIISEHTKDFPLDFSQIIINESIYDPNNPQGKNLQLDLSIVNPYIDGLQLTTNSSKNFLTTIQEVPNQEEINNPILLNNSSIKSQLPSVSEVGVQQAFTNGNFNETPGVVGTSSNDLIQIPPRILPFITNLQASTDDFLGTMTINYTLSTGSINSLPIDGTIKINGFFGLVYIIPIVLGSIILVGGIVLLIFLILKRKHNENLKASISSGFKLYSSKGKKDSVPHQKITAPNLVSTPNSSKNGNNLSTNKVSPPPITKKIINSNQKNEINQPNKQMSPPPLTKKIINSNQTNVINPPNRQTPPNRSPGNTPPISHR